MHCAEPSRPNLDHSRTGLPSGGWLALERRRVYNRPEMENEGEWPRNDEKTGEVESRRCH